MILLPMKLRFFALVLGFLCYFSGCSPSVNKTKEKPSENNHSYVIEEISDVADFGSFYISLKRVLKEKLWEELFEKIPQKDRNYFEGPKDFSSYMEKNNRFWELAVLNELSSHLEYDEAGIRTIEIYFEAQILPGPTRHNASLKFLFHNNEWSVLGLERLRLSRISFEH